MDGVVAHPALSSFPQASILLLQLTSSVAALLCRLLSIFLDAYPG